MFVRNNTVCSHCGKSRIVDVYLEEVLPSEWGGTFRAECFECLAFISVDISFREIRLILREISKDLPSGHIGRLAYKWSDRYDCDKQHQRKAVIRLSRAMFRCGEIDGKLLEHSSFKSLCSRIESSGEAPQPCFISLDLHGQPLAS